MGKYMRKGKGAGKVAVMEVSQGALGVRTRAKTLALEHDRKLALARNASLKQQRQAVACVGSFTTCYLELRSRKLEKVLKESERPAKGAARLESIRETDPGKLEKATFIMETECRVRPASGQARIDSEEEFHGEVVGSSRTPELSPKRVDDFDVLKDFAIIDSGLSTPRATFEEAQLRCMESGVAEEPSWAGGVFPSARSDEGGLALPGEWSLIAGGLPRHGQSARRLQVETSCEYTTTAEPGSSSMRRHFFGSPVSSSSKDRESVDEDRGSSTRLAAMYRQGRRISNHRSIMNRAYMRTNLFVDEEAIDGLFATPDSTEREEGKRFTERYNYDVVNDKPLKGRYEWIAEAKPCTTMTRQHQVEQP